MQDSKLLHFLKQFPPWIVLLALTVFFVVLYVQTQDGSFKEWTSLILASLFTALGVKSQQQLSSTTNTDTANTSIKYERLNNNLQNLSDNEIDKIVNNIKEEK